MTAGNASPVRREQVAKLMRLARAQSKAADRDVLSAEFEEARAATHAALRESTPEEKYQARRALGSATN
ncbi:hypothetical protein [Micromonospora chalcea]|uniref:Uncharacterized protein n=1 Tax=Micromonospora chalcea TaxID=1874 RepID=A0ABX9YDC0_MICCH|nr:hypothetical protein [Micromonospora chalcea]RQW98509.1 hypothetical protein DLJ60_01155 [Micromonospora chalcea]RQX59321.1 hypothetical protein DLJ57_02795 [Micromonospora chalcea]